MRNRIAHGYFDWPRGTLASRDSVPLLGHHRPIIGTPKISAFYLI
jgi:hypothetical protein